MVVGWALSRRDARYTPLLNGANHGVEHHKAEDTGCVWPSDTQTSLTVDEWTRSPAMDSLRLCREVLAQGVRTS